MNSDDDLIVLTKGSIYTVHSLNSKDAPFVTTGRFLGYTGLGSVEEAICIEMEGITQPKMKGKMRVIPLGMVLAIDVMEPIQRNKDDDQGENLVYYG